MPVSYISHKGREILHVDFNGIKDKNQVMMEIDEMKKFYVEAPDNIYLLMDITGTFTDPEVMDKLKDYGKKYFKGKSKKRALLGISGIKALLMKAYSLATKTELKTFNSTEEAKNYLATD